MSKKDVSQKVGAGVGYVSVMLIFAVICLAVFAVFSFKAAISSDHLNDRSGEFLKQYYAADSSAKETLSALNDFALESADAFDFEEELEMKARTIDGVSAKRTAWGVRTSYTVTINERQELAVEILFSADGKYSIDTWRAQNIGSGNSGDGLNVWDGTFDF